LIALCERRERCTSSKRYEDQNIKSESDKLKEKKFATFELYFVRYKSYQCFFYLNSVNLANDNRRHNFVIRYSLKRHLQRCYAKRLQRSNDIYCSHSYVNCVELIFKDLKHFKNYVAQVHFVEM
jgi:coenzyme F420-reducing hydrogenase alpha subunit